MTDHDELQFYFFHFMPYIHLPKDHKKYHSTWVDLPNAIYDPKKGHELYKRYIGEMVLADKLGFDAICVNEHHGTAYSMMPTCSLMAATLIPQTSRAKICVFGTPVNLEFPSRVAEEYAMLDVMSGGRLEIALPLGTGMEYWVHPINPATSRARFRESVDIMLQAWTRDSPTEFHGEFYDYRFLNVWPKPYQKPHPRIYVVGTGSPETIEFAAEYGFGYASVFVPTKKQLATFKALKEKTEGYGHTWDRHKPLVNVWLYVGESKERAVEEFEPHIRYFFETCARVAPNYLFPPGYLSTAQFHERVSRPALHGEFNWTAATEQFRVMAGTPDQVAEAIVKWVEEANSSRVVCHLHLGDMPHWKTVKSMTLFAEEVIPKVRKAVGRKVPAAARGKRMLEVAE
jgi:alkanesulfonate monooxygenase SsuD/methylene tetrahydromethanopterin reductase-like flavin-dependent oxidoreductase (luciferase family)